MEHPASDGSRFRATFSAGVAMLDTKAMDLERWRKAADDALYQAKRTGRGRVVAAARAHDGAPA
jgi:PleD family two-component response regulator